MLKGRKLYKSYNIHYNSISNILKKIFFIFFWILFYVLSFNSNVLADPYPPYWSGGNGESIHFQPAPWPIEPIDPKDCSYTCGDWKPYTRFQREMADPRIQDPSNGGTSPQNYVNVASSCIDKTLPSIYYYLYKHPTDSTKDVIMFRWRVEQIANTYATGPSAGNYGSTDPWNSALWTVLFDIDGDGYRDLAAHLNGSSGSPSTPVDRIFGIWGNIPTQSLDYINDPNIHIIAHNPTGFVGTSKLLNFHDSLSPDENWPSGSSTNSWDYGTTRSKLITTSTCNEYFVDYQIPVAMLDATGLGGPRITRDTPISMLFCTANSLNNPFQKDCAINKKWVGDAARPAPFGDYLSFNETAPYQQPIVSSVTAIAPTGCPGNYTFTAKVQDTIAIVNGVAVTTVKEVDFYYYYDTDGNGNADDGNLWTFAASGILKTGSLNTWTAIWNATSLPKGKYLIGVQAVDAEYIDNNSNNIYDAGDISLLDDGMTPTENHNRTFSYLTKSEVDALTPPVNETWFANPDITSTQMAVIGVAINNCGLAPTMTKTASSNSVIAGDTVDFTLTITNLLNTTLTVNEIIDVLPPGFNYVNDSTSGNFGTANPSINGQTLIWTFSSPVNIDAGNSASLTFTANSTSVSGNYTNSAYSETSFGTIVSNPFTIGVDSARLSFTKTPDKYLVDPGGTVTYNLSYSNDSSVTITNAIISDTLPSNVNCTSYSLNGGIPQSCSGQNVTIPLGNIAGGESGNVTLNVTVNSNYNSPSLLNTATISGIAPDVSTVSKTATSTIAVNVPVPAFTLVKTGPVQVAPSGSVTWTITYKNYGTGSASGVTITDTLPGGFTYSSCTGGISCSGSGNNVSWTIGTVAAGVSGSVTVTANVASAPFTYDNPAVNNATITWTGNSTGVSAQATVGITGQACSGVYYFHNDFTATTTPPISGTDTETTISTSGGYIMFTSPPASSSIVLKNKTLSIDFYINAGAGNITLSTELQDFDPNTSDYTVIVSNSQTLSNKFQWFNYTVTIPNNIPDLAVGHQLRWKFTVTWTGNKSIIFYYDGPHDSRSSFCVPTSPANLTISKIVDQPNIPSGSTPTLNYLITYSNTGGQNVIGVNLDDTLPSNVNCYRYSSNCTNWSDPNTCSSWTLCSGNPVTLISNGTISSGATGNILLQANVQSGASGTLTNTATISGTGVETKSATANTIVGSLSGGGSPSLAVSLSTDKTTANPGDTVTYTITVVNVGSGDAIGVVVSDAYPIQDINGNTVTGFYTYGTCSNSCTNSSGTLSWNVGTLSPGQSVTFTYTMVVGNSGLPAGVTIIPDTAQAYAGNITEGSPGSPTNPAQSNQVNVTLNGNPVLSLVKNANPSNDLKPGDTITYTLTVTNTGSSTAENVVVTDPIPAYTSFKEITQGNGSFDSVNNRLVFNVGTLTSGSSTTLIFSVTVNELPSGSTTVSNIATATASNTSSRTANASALASASPAFTLSKEGPEQMANPAAKLIANVNNNTVIFVSDSTQFTERQFIYLNSTILQIISISGNAITVDIPVSASTGDDIISGITYNITYQNTGNATATGVTLTDTLPVGSIFVMATDGGLENSGVVTWNLGNIEPGIGGTVQVVIIPGSTGTITNNASIYCTNCTEPVNASVSTSVGGLRVSKSTTTPTTPAPGTVTYIIEVENTLGSDANDVTITDILPPGFTFASTTSIVIDGNTVSPTTEPTVGDNTLVWSSFSIPTGKKLILTFTANVDETVGPATYQNESGATSSNTSVIPFDPLLTTEEDVTVLAERTGVIEGYVFRDNDNNGLFDPAVDTPLPGVNVNITDSTSTLYIITTDSSGYFKRVVASGEANVDINDSDIPIGLILGSSFTDPTTVNVPEQDCVTKNTGYIPLSTSADLAITKTDGAMTAVPGQGVTYTITVTNNGPSDVVGATVTDTFSAMLSNINWTCSASSGSSCAASGNGNINDTVNILSGGTLTYTVTATISASATGSLSNTATVTAPEGTPDTNTKNNTSTDTNTLAPRADLSITKTDSIDPVIAGNNLTYTITVSNAGPSDTVNVIVTDTLPSGVALVSTSGCSEDPSGVPTCSLGTITAGNSKQYTVNVTVNSGTTGTITNSVSVTSDTFDTNTNNNFISENTTVNAPNVFDPPSGTKTVNDAGYPVLEWRMVWINNGTAPAERQRIIDTIPVNTTYINGSLNCIERGASVRISCYYDSIGKRIIWEGNIAPDSGATNENEASNEVIITFRTTVNAGITKVSNQGFAYWDENEDGSVLDDISRGQIPISTDDPNTTDFRDPTVWNYKEPLPIPAINGWGEAFLFVLLMIVSVLYLRMQEKLKV